MRRHTEFRTDPKKIENRFLFSFDEKIIKKTLKISRATVIRRLREAEGATE
ncbi:MAG: hypothetical protein PUI29_05145 [Aeromonadales bacterium]|nr:hypothetical protein [Aeromonadales bacterium]MDY2891330.1 hypothetical protein [Succinivibrio sp.]